MSQQYKPPQTRRPDIVLLDLKEDGSFPSQACDSDCGLMRASSIASEEYHPKGLEAAVFFEVSIGPKGLQTQRAPGISSSVQIQIETKGHAGTSQGPRLKPQAAASHKFAMKYRRIEASSRYHAGPSLLWRTIHMRCMFVLMRCP